ncbi:MAG: DNA alkylation repair protein [[Eubacterium] sulci]|nr:DNA alkylation repair protein [[Eubacterium] sulci]
MTTAEDIRNRLMDLKDEEYKAFNSKLIPNVDESLVIGVRVPALRKLEKELRTEDLGDWLSDLPHKYLEENTLHGIVISNMKSQEDCLFILEEFLPYIDNWATCDIINPKVLAKDKDGFLSCIKSWIRLEHLYTSRFGMEMLMSYFLDDEFKEEYLELPASVKSEEYYLNMMIAWFFATALAKQWDSAIVYLENNRLSKWTHNKTIQKAIESYRISPEQKEYLRGLKIK